jgi:hypothetical protein
VAVAVGVAVGVEVRVAVAVGVGDGQGVVKPRVTTTSSTHQPTEPLVLSSP